MATAIKPEETAETVSTPTSMEDFELEPVKACLVNDPDCESCQ